MNRGNAPFAMDYYLNARMYCEKYKLYDNKICTGDEAAECRYCMENRMKGIGYQVVVSRGDYANF